MDLIQINQVDILAVLAAFSIAWVSQTKTSAITAGEFLLYAAAANFILYYEITSPFVYLVFALICYISAHFHIICTSSKWIIASFVIPMLYNVAMFYDWGYAQWVVSGQYGVIDKYHTIVMFLCVAAQLITTAIYGGFRDGLRRWINNFSNNDTPYLFTSQGAPK